MKTFFGFGLADSMFPPDCKISRQPLTDEQTQALITEGVVSCLNPSHSATVTVMRARGFDVEIPPSAPLVKLAPGDRLVVFGVSGLPRLEGRHEYTAEEIEAAKFRVGLYTVAPA